MVLLKAANSSILFTKVKNTNLKVFVANTLILSQHKRKCKINLNRQQKYKPEKVTSLNVLLLELREPELIEEWITAESSDIMFLYLYPRLFSHSLGALVKKSSSIIVHIWYKHHKPKYPAQSLNGTCAFQKGPRKPYKLKFYMWLHCSIKYRKDKIGCEMWEM